MTAVNPVMADDMTMMMGRKGQENDRTYLVFPLSRKSVDGPSSRSLR